MAKLIWTDRAFQSLEEIRDYIAQHNPEAAAKTIAGIYAKTERLQSFPRLGYAHQDGSFDEVRVVIYGHYRITYLVDGETVVVTGVIHTARNSEKDN